MKKKTYKITFPGKKTGDKGIFVFEGELTIANIEQIKEEIGSSFRGFDKVSVKLKNVGSFDLTIIQYLNALKVTLEKENKDFDLDILLNEELRELYERSGFHKSLVELK